ncbi:TRAP transporter large permease [Brevibacillus panacihumi]|uniref:TRAP transporter large permease n=1 Tax=Brevibacillus panacihumi TaxID=497735 RepID=UPI003CFFCB66
MESYLYFGAFIIALLAFLATGISVAVAMGIIGVLGTLIFISPNALSQLGSIALNQSSSMVLIVVPLFVLMSEALAASPIGSNLFRTAQLWLGRIPGALGMSTILTSAGFSAVCGSSPVTAATIGSVAVPEMVKNGYDRKLALGLTAAGGTLGILIPPSVAMILYGVITETSIGALFIAGIVPGLMIAGLLCLTVWIKVLLNPQLAPPVKTSVTWGERMGALKSVLPVLLLGVAVMGAIYSGIATPTESGAVGAAVALIIVGVSGYLAIHSLKRILENTVKTTAMFLFLVIGGMFSSFVLNRIGIPQGMAEILTSMDMPGWVIIVGINILLLILGMFLDPMSILVIMVPIFFPTVISLGYDPVWFGILVTINTEIAAITPPVGFNLFVLKNVIPKVTIAEVTKGALIFILPLAVGLLLLIFLPEIALFLPSMMK